MRELTVDFEVNQKTPLYEQIYNFIRNEIKNGRIGCKTKLPSTRALALHLQVSRSTVDMAYAQLVSEGYIESIPYKGYYVSEISLLYNINSVSNGVIPCGELEEQKYKIDFSPYGIDLEAFPYNIWRKIYKNILSADNKELFSSGNSKGDYELRKTLCNYLYEARGVKCTPEMIIIGSGNEYLLMLLNQLFKQKEIIAMENPTYMHAYNVFKRNENEIYPIPMDKSGIKIKDLYQSSANIAYVMPSHQFPLGVVMPIKRRIELLEWAREKAGRYIIEDDYDSEFRYRGKPIPSLQGVDVNKLVIYMGTFSKSIAPAIRMSYMVLPESLLKIYESFHGFSQTVSRIDQMVVNEFIKNDYFERHLNKMRSIYKGKHDAVISSLKDCKDNVTIWGENSGLHVLITIRNGPNEESLVKQAKNAGIKVYGLSKYFISNHDNLYAPTVLLGFANLSIEQIKEGIKILRKVWRI